MLKKYAELWNEIEYLVKTINGDEAGKYRKDFMKIRFESADNLLLNEISNLHKLTIVVDLFFKRMVNIIHRFS